MAHSRPNNDRDNTPSHSKYTSGVPDSPSGRLHKPDTSQKRGRGKSAGRYPHQLRTRHRRTLTAFGSYVLARMEQQGLSKEAVIVVLHITSERLWRLLEGKGMIRFPLLVRLAALLDTPEYILWRLLLYPEMQETGELFLLERTWSLLPEKGKVALWQTVSQLREQYDIEQPIEGVEMLAQEGASSSPIIDVPMQSRERPPSTKRQKAAQEYMDLIDLLLIRLSSHTKKWQPQYQQFVELMHNDRYHRDDRLELLGILIRNNPQEHGGVLTTENPNLLKDAQEFLEQRAEQHRGKRR